MIGSCRYLRGRRDLVLAWDCFILLGSFLTNFFWQWFSWCVLNSASNGPQETKCSWHVLGAMGQDPGALRHLASSTSGTFMHLLSIPRSLDPGEKHFAAESPLQRWAVATPMTCALLACQASFAPWGALPSCFQEGPSWVVLTRSVLFGWGWIGGQKLSGLCSFVTTLIISAWCFSHTIPPGTSVCIVYQT